MPQSSNDAASNTTKIGTWRYDSADHQLVCDRTMASIFALDETEIETTIPFSRLRGVIDPRDQLRISAESLASIHANGVHYTEYRLRPINGITRRILSHGRYDFDQDGRILRGHGIVIDITDFKSYTEGTGEQDADPSATRPLEQAAEHALAARRAIDDSGSHRLSFLRTLIDALLLELGRHLSVGR